MVNGFVIFKKTILKAVYLAALTATFLLGITTFIAFTALFDFHKKKGEHLGLSLEPFYERLVTVFSQLREFTLNSFLDFSGNPQVINAFSNSYKILGISLVTIIAFGSLIAFLVVLSPIRLRSILLRFLDYFESLPDLLFIFAINMLNIFLLKEFNIKIFPMYGFGSARPVAFPVIVISFLPAVLFGLYLLKNIEEEEEEQYIHFGMAKGLSKIYLYSIYMIRNILPVFTIKFRMLLYMLLSNLILVEHMYHYEITLTNLIMMEMFMGKNALTLIYSIVIFILPAILLEYLIKFSVKMLVIRKSGEIQI